MAGTGIRLFLSGEIAYASDVNTFLMDQVISVFSTPDIRDNAFGDGYPTTEINPSTSVAGSGKPALSEGRFCYVKFQNDGTTPLREVQYYNGTTWVSASQFTVGDGTITEAKLAANSVTSDKIAPGTVVAADIGNNTITEAKLTTSVAGSGLAGGNGTALSVNVDNSTVEINSDTVRIKDLGVTTAKLNDGAVTSEKLDTNISIDGNLTVAGTSFIAEIIEKVHKDTSPTSTTDIDMLDAGIHYFSTSHSTGFILNFVGDGTNSFDELTEINQSVTGVVLITSGSTSGKPTAIHIDGVEITDVKWFGGVEFPDGGGTGDIDSYTITIIKTSETPTYLVLASQSRFA